MAASMSKRIQGCERLLNKIQNAVDKGEFYEAHQMYKTIYFRYLSQKRYPELLDLMYNGACVLLDRNQHSSGIDVANLFIDVLQKSKTKPNDDNMTKIARLLSLINSEIPEREAFLSSAVQWSSADYKLGHPTLHQLLAKVFWKEKNYILARRHFLRSCDGYGFGSMLVELHQTSGYTSEVDLFIAQVVLQCLCLKNKRVAVVTFECYTSEHPFIEGPPYLLPLLNFIAFLLKAVDSGALNAFRVLCEEYSISLKRDPSYMDYLDKIGQIFFGLPPKRQPRSLFGNFFQSFLNGLGESSSDTEPENGAAAAPGSEPATSSSASSRPVMESELD